MSDQPILLKHFEDLLSGDWDRRERARETLRALGPQAVLIIDQLLQNTADVSGRAELLEVLALIGPDSLAAWPTVAHELSSPHPALRRRALEILERMGPENISVLGELLNLLHDAEPAVRRHAALALGCWRERAEEVVPALVHSLLDEDHGVRHAAATAIRSYGPQSVKILLRYFDDTAVKIQAQVAWALGRMRDAGKEAVPVLAACLEASSARLRKAASLALGKIGVAAIPALVHTLERGSAKAREESAMALGVMARSLDSKEGLRSCLPVLMGLLEMPQHRETAARTMESMGSIAVEALLTLFEKDDPGLQELALESLERMRSQALPALPQLIACLSNAEGALHERLSETLGALGAAAVDPLLEALDSEDNKVRQGVVRAFATMAKRGTWRSNLLVRVLPKLINALGHRGIREDVARTLGALGKPAVPFLLGVIRGGKLSRRRFALWALGRIGPEAESAVGVLIELLQTSDEALHPLAREALANIGLAAIPQLLACLKDSLNQQIGVQALERMGVLAVPDLLEALQGEESRSHPTIVRVLAAIVQGDEEFPGDDLIFTLQSCLCATDAQLRQAAVEATSALGEKRETLIVNLLPLLKDEDELVRGRTIDALVSIGEAAVPPLVATLAGDEVDVRREAAEALAKMGESAVAGLCEALRSEAPEVRREAARTLGRIGHFGGSAKSAVPALIEALEDETTRCAAAFALGEICASLAHSVPALIGLLADSDREARWWSAHALGAIARRISRHGSGTIVYDAVFELAAALDDECEEVREKAAWALTGLGQGARLAISELMAAVLKGSDEAVFALRASGAGENERTLAMATLYQSRSQVLKKLESDLDLNEGLSKADDVAEKLREGMLSESLERRCLAIRGVGLLGADGRHLSSELVEQLRDTQPLVASCAAWALEQVGRSAIPQLLKLLEEVELELSVRSWGLLALQRMARLDRLRKETVPASREAVRVLMTMFHSSRGKPFLSQLVLRGLGVMGVEQTAVLPLVTGALADERLQRSATRSLEELGTPALDTLFESLTNPKLRRGAQGALSVILARVGLSKVLEKTLEALHHPNPAVRGSAGRLLKKAVEEGATGADTRRLVPEIVDTLKDSSATNRAVAAKVLAALGQKTEQGESSARIVPALQEALFDGDSEVRQNVGRTLAELAPHYHGALLELSRRPEDADTVIRQQSAWALGEIQERGSEIEAIRAQASLISLVRDPSPRVRKAAVRSLSRGQGNGLLASTLSQSLKDQDFGVRWEAVWAFWTVGPESVSELIDSLADPAEADQAISVLGEIGRAAVPDLVEALQFDEMWPRVVEALALVGEGAVSELVNALAEGHLRERASVVLGTIGLSAAPALIEALKDPEVRQIAAASLGRMGVAAIPPLIVALRDSDSGIRVGAARALGRLGPLATGRDADTCVNALCDGLSDKHSRVRSCVARALGQMGSKICAPRVVEELITSLMKNPNSIREECARALGLICQSSVGTDKTQEAKMALPALLEAIRADHGGVRTAASRALGQLGPVAIEAVSELLSNKWVLVRLAGIEALEKIGHDLPNMAAGSEPVLQELVGSLLRSLKDDDPKVCNFAAEALGRLEGGLASAKRHLEELITKGEGTQRKALLQAFQKLEGRSERGVSVLILALKDQDPELRALSAKLLSSFGDKAANALESLVAGLSDTQVQVRVHCAQALGSLGKKAESARAQLLTALEDDNKEMRSAVCLALAKMGVGRAKTLPGLLAERLEDKDSKVRVSAVQALGVLGSGAMAVSSTVVAALEDSNNNVCIAACRALAQMDVYGGVSPQALATILEDPGRDRELKGEALRALTLILRDAPEEIRLSLVTALVNGFEESFDGGLRCSFVAALGSCAPYLDRRQSVQVLDLVSQWPLEELERTSQTVFVRTIERIGLATPAVVNALLEAFQSGIPRLELMAAAVFRGLEYQDPIDVERVFGALLGGLEHPSPEHREAVIESLAVLSLKFDREEVLRDFMAALEDDVMEVRHAALRGLSQFGMASEGVLEALVGALKEESVGMRLTAIHGLASLARGAPMVLGPLLAVLEDPDKDVQEAAAYSLSHIGREMQACVTVLEAELRVAEVAKRRLVTEILGRFSTHTALVVKALKRALKDSDLGVQSLAVAALANLGDRAIEAIPDLVTRLQKSEGSLRLQVVRAFEKIGAVGREAVPALLLVMEHEEEAVIQSLSAMGTAANRAIPTFIERLAEPKYEFRSEVEWALTRFGKPAAEDLAQLESLLQHPSAEIRRRSLEGIATLGFLPVALLPAILGRLDDVETDIRQGAMKLVDRRPAFDQSYLPLVIGLLDREHPELLMKVMECLAELGRDAGEAVPGVMKIFAGGSDSLRRCAAETLGHIAIGMAPPQEMLKQAQDSADSGLLMVIKRALEKIRGELGHRS
jgi:HEAT repeat protein